ncbi:hypothetical protein [Streptomyces chartreusis]
MKVWPWREEADRVRGPGELPVQLPRPHPRIPLQRNDQLARQPGQLDATGVEQERQPLRVAVLAFGHIGEGERPVLAQHLHQMAQSPQFPAHLLHRHHIALAQHRGNYQEIPEVALR